MYNKGVVAKKENMDQIMQGQIYGNIGEDVVDNVCRGSLYLLVAVHNAPVNLEIALDVTIFYYEHQA